VNTRLRRLLGAAALGGGLFFLSTGTAGAEPDVDLSGTTIDADDLLGVRNPDQTIETTLPAGVEAILGDNDVVVGDRPAPIDAEVVTSPLPDPVVVTPPAEVDAAADDSTASVVAPVATVDPDVVVCGNAAGVVGEAAAACDPAADSGTTGTTAEPGSVDLVLGERAPLSGTVVDGDLPEVVADPDVLVCGNAVSIVGEATGACAPDAEPAPAARAGDLDLVVGEGTPVSGTELDSRLPGVLLDPDAVVCGNGIAVLGDAGGGCAPAASTNPVAGAGSVDLVMGGSTPLTGTTLTGDTPGVVAAPDVLACGNGVGILGDGTGGCDPASTPEPLTPIDAFDLELVLGEDAPLGGSSAAVDLSNTALDPNAAVCGNGVGVLGDGMGTCGTTGGPIPALPLDPSGVIEVVIDLGDDLPLPVLPVLPVDPDLPGLPDLPVDPVVVVPPVIVGGSGDTPDPVTPPAPTPGTPAPGPGVGADGTLDPIGVGGAGTFGPLGSAAGTFADLAAAAGSAFGDLMTGAAGALASTGFGIRAVGQLALVLLALGALLLAGRRRVELHATLA